MADSEKGIGVPAKPIATISDFAAIVNNAYKRPMVSHGNKGNWILNVPRFSSGIIGLDEALGGGWPIGKLVLIGGEFSTGKTDIAINAAASIQNYDHTTRTHKLLLPPEKKFEPGKILWIDAENAFDKDWAIKKGIDMANVTMVRPETAEEAIDIVKVALNQQLFDLIVVDSIAQLVPSTELEFSSEDWQMGLAARLFNKAYRQWNATLAKRSCNMMGSGPTVIVLNQMRYKIGIVYGDPRTLPGGQQQIYCSSIILYTRAASYNSKEQAEMESVELGGIVYKNKTAIPRQNYSFSLQLKGTTEAKAGEIDNAKQLVKKGKELRLVTKNTGTGYTFAGVEYRTLEELENACKNSEALQFKLWRSVISISTGLKV